MLGCRACVPRRHLPGIWNAGTWNGTVRKLPRPKNQIQHDLRSATKSLNQRAEACQRDLLAFDVTACFQIILSSQCSIHVSMALPPALCPLLRPVDNTRYGCTDNPSTYYGFSSSRRHVSTSGSWVSFPGPFACTSLDPTPSPDFFVPPDIPPVLKHMMF